jgi:FHA domain
MRSKRAPGGTTSTSERDDVEAPRDATDLDEVAALSGEELPARGLAPREPITSLRWFGRGGHPLLLSSSKPRFTLGTRACDLLVPRGLAAGVSPLHAVIEREDGALRVIDQDSINGTYRSLGAPRMASLQVQAGESFWIAGTRVLALDTQLEVLRPRLARCLGLERHAAVDEALALVAEGRPLALIGPPGLDAGRLAESIHEASPQRQHPFIAVTASPLPDLTGVRAATVFVDVERVKKLSAPWLRRLFDPARSLRVVFAASDERRLWARLDSYRDRVRALVLVPLAHRPDDVLLLLARHWIDELRTTRRIEELGPGLVSIAAYDWPGNFDELREHSRRLLVYLEHGGLRPAASALGIKHQTLAAHLARIGYAGSRWSPHRGGPSEVRDGGMYPMAPDLGGAAWLPLWPLFRGEACCTHDAPVPPGWRQLLAQVPAAWRLPGWPPAVGARAMARG